jgi:glucan phosphorylase
VTPVWLECGVQELREHADDPAFQKQWQDVKATAKAKSMALIERLTSVALPKNAMLDVQVKRIHEVCFGDKRAGLCLCRVCL